MLEYTTDELWIHFGDGRRAWTSRCAECRRLAIQERQLHRHALACWKLELWYRAWEHEDAITSLLLEWAEVTPGFTAKASRVPLPVVPSDASQAPYPEVPESRVALVYYHAQEPLQQGMAECQRRLEMGGAGRGRLYWRRGCWAYDQLFGVWTGWPPPPAAAGEPGRGASVGLDGGAPGS